MLTFTLHTMRSANRCLPYEWSIDLMPQRHTCFYRYDIVCRETKALANVSPFYCEFLFAISQCVNLRFFLHVIITK